MADFTAKDVQSPAPGHRRRDDGRQEGAHRERRRHGSRQAVAAREGPGQGRPSSATARTPRARSPRWSTARSAPSSQLKSETDFSAKADDFTSLVQDLAELVVAKGADAVAELADGDRRPEDRQEGEHRGRHRRPLRGRRGQPPRLLPAHPGRPRRQRRARRAARAAPRSWPTTSPCTSPSPSPPFLSRDEVPADDVERERPGPARHHQGRGQARAGVAEDRRGSPERLVQGAGPARAGLRPRREDDHRPAPRRRHPGALRPGLHRRLMPASLRPLVAGPAQGVRRGLRRRGRLRHRRRAWSQRIAQRDRRGPRPTSASRSRSWWAAATSGGA